MYIFEKVDFKKVVSSPFLLVDYTNYNYLELSIIIIYKFSWYRYTILEGKILKKRQPRERRGNKILENFFVMSIDNFWPVVHATIADLPLRI